MFTVFNNSTYIMPALLLQHRDIPDDFKPRLYEDFLINCRSEMRLCSFHDGKLIFKATYQSRNIPDFDSNGFSPNSAYNYYAAIPINSDFISSDDFYSGRLCYVYASKMRNFLFDVSVF